ncbi:glycoside hydrolase family 2 protein [Actinoplanes sichuanensis]|uniref:beta-mannosidase n=1 Tax=Actinoplanes sichuanensis TaxID=512349 RepID=A0ABW4ANQ1_9ACTN|nr:glycoside hydrolase family 2 protein [Actinoplanes sichuanensis]BEL06843.1 glycoside hydrolase family 2 protein [Actinoplanes sichuanensis]
MIKSLSGTWTLRPTSPNIPASTMDTSAFLDIPAVVPGCVHTDLLAAGLIPDPFLDDNELKVAWVGRTDWTYSRPISWDGPAHDQIDLVFDGLDTVARIEIDGHLVGETRNMHRSYRFNVTEALKRPKPAQNTAVPAAAGGDDAGGERMLSVHFTSAYTEAERVRELVGPRPNAYPEPFQFIRKMACSFGWDWGPTLVTAGIWRGVHLDGWSIARLATVRPLATYSGGVGRLDLTADIERTRDRPLRARVLVDDREIAVVDVPAGQNNLHARVDVPGVTPWSPVGHGEPALYMLTVILTDVDDGTELDRYQQLTGFRSVNIDSSQDEAGTRFVVHVNGAPVLIKGVNWIPDDIFPSRMTRERYELRLREAVAAGVNLIRVWGGGIYEDRDFYELCDRLGLMVWQDFLFACACYPEEEPIRSEVLAEARDNVLRLSPHPSLITWNGNNENLWLRGAHGWTDDPGGDRSWGEAYYLSLLPDLLSELDPSRPYQAGSPWSGSWEHEPNDPAHQTFHSWEVWNRQDYLHYRDSAPRFVAEFGWQGPPAWRTLRDAVSDEPIRPDSPGVLHHQKAEDGNGKLARGLAPHFPAPSTVEVWHYLTQLNQVRAVRTGIEHWRSFWPHTAGTILWQLNDLWPVTSWAAIDGAGRYKPLYFALREMYAERALTIQPRDGGLVVAVLNDSPHPWTGILQINEADVEVSAPPRSVALIPVPADISGDAARVDGEGDPAPNGGGPIVAEMDGTRALWFADEARSDAARQVTADMVFGGDPGLTVSAEVVPGGLDVQVHATGLARDVLLQPDRIHPEAVVDRGFTTLLPGESTVFAVRARVELDPGSIKAPWVLTDLWSALRHD